MINNPVTQTPGSPAIEAALAGHGFKEYVPKTIGSLQVILGTDSSLQFMVATINTQTFEVKMEAKAIPDINDAFFYAHRVLEKAQTGAEITSSHPDWERFQILCSRYGIGSGQ